MRRCVPAASRSRPLARVRRLAVDVHHQRLQLLLEEDVVVRAAEPPLVAELVERDAAHRTGLLVQLGQLFGGLADGKLLGQRPAIVGAELARPSLA